MRGTGCCAIAWWLARLTPRTPSAMPLGYACDAAPAIAYISGPSRTSQAVPATSAAAAANRTPRAGQEGRFFSATADSGLGDSVTGLLRGRFDLRRGRL